MGNYKFRFSDMIPNAWFYKLKDMSSKAKSSSNNQTILDSKKKRHHHHPPPPPPPSKPKQQPLPPPSQSYSRKSYYYSREVDSNDAFYFPEPPRKSSKQHRTSRRKTTKSAAKHVSSSVSAGCSCRTTAESVWTKSDSPPEFSTSPFNTETETEPDPFESDIIIDVDKESLTTKTKYDDSLSELDLPPIITKHAKFKKETKQRTSPTRKFPVNSPGIKLRIQSPKIANKKISQANGRKSVSSSRRSLSESFAIMKSSYDPQRDFRESMVEMIVENNIRASKDLEDLLACYLSLNADEYHDLIIKVFKQIWFDLTEIAN